MCGEEVGRRGVAFNLGLCKCLLADAVVIYLWVCRGKTSASL